MTNIDSSVHCVQIIETDASIRCGLLPSTEYQLSVQLSQVVLQQDNQVLLQWPFRHVRRYGYTTNSFSVEVGSKCDTGEGLFIFRSRRSIQLYHQVIENVAKIKQLKSRQLVRTGSMEVAQSTVPSSQSSSIRSSVLDAHISESANHNNQLHNQHSIRSSIIPHYKRNECEYAQVVRRSAIIDGACTHGQSSTTTTTKTNKIDSERPLIRQR